MSQRTAPSPSHRPARRHERRDGYDIADIYEARLLAHGLRSDDFIALRSSTDIPSIPDLTPIRFGRGADQSVVHALAVIEVEDQPEPDPESAEPTASPES